MIEKPAISSLASANGPSITVGLPFANETRAPRELGISPAPDLHLAALDQLLVVAGHVVDELLARACAPASVSASALRMTMNCMSPS